MKKLDVSLEEILYEYDKYTVSYLINRPYDFSILRNKLKEFSKKSDFFDYDDNKTDLEIVKEISKKIKVSKTNT